MKVILFLMACSILVAGGFLVAYIWSVKSGQYNDLEADSYRILHDSKPKSNQKNN